MNYRENYNEFELRRIWNLYRYHHQREFGNRRAPSGRLWWVVKLKEDIRHQMRQNLHDYARRGETNREGSKNRRWRAWKATQPQAVYSCYQFELVA